VQAARAAGVKMHTYSALRDRVSVPITFPVSIRPLLAEIRRAQYVRGIDGRSDRVCGSVSEPLNFKAFF
jgi:hypothetical protein